jgi:WD40 repeat protein
MVWATLHAWRVFLRTNLRAILLAALLFGGTVLAIQWVLPVTPRTILKLADDPECLKFSPDNRTFGGRLRVWDLKTGKEQFAVAQATPARGSFATFGRTPLGKLDRVIVWSSPADGPPRRLSEFRISADRGAFSPDLSRMACFNWPDDPKKRTEIELWDMVTGRKRCSFAYNERDTRIESLSFSDNGKVLVANAEGGSPLDWYTRTTLWDVTSTPTQIGSFSPPATLSSDGKWLAVPTPNGATLYRVARMERRANLTVTGDIGPYIWWATVKEYPSLLFSPDTRLIAVAGLRTEPRLPTMNWMPPWITRLIYASPKNELLVRLWETETGKQHAAFSDCSRVIFSPDGKLLATLHNGVFKVWEVPLHRSLATSLAWAAVLWLPLTLVWRCTIRLSHRGRR